MISLLPFVFINRSNCSYLWNQVTKLNGICCKRYLCKWRIQSVRKIKIEFDRLQTHFAWLRQISCLYIPTKVLTSFYSQAYFTANWKNQNMRFNSCLTYALNMHRLDVKGLRKLLHTFFMKIDHWWRPFLNWNKVKCLKSIIINIWRSVIRPVTNKITIVDPNLPSSFWGCSVSIWSQSHFWRLGKLCI